MSLLAIRKISAI